MLRRRVEAKTEGVEARTPVSRQNSHKTVCVDSIQVPTFNRTNL